MYRGQLFKIFVEERLLAESAQFILLPQCFQLYSITKVLILKDLPYLSKDLKNCLLQICFIWERDITLPNWKHLQKEMIDLQIEKNTL